MGTPITQQHTAFTNMHRPGSNSRNHFSLAQE